MQRFPKLESNKATRQSAIRVPRQLKSVLKRGDLIMSRLSMQSRCKSLLMVFGLILAPGLAGDAAAAGFQPWDLPGIVPPERAPWRFDRGECRHEQIGGAVGGLIGGVIGSRIGRSRLATTAFGSIFGYVIGSQIGRSMDQSEAACAQRPPRSIDDTPPAGTTAIRI
jgi:hypothetical protein